MPSTVTLAAVAKEVPAPENGQVTAALRTPVLQQRQAEDLEVDGRVGDWLEAEVDRGPRVAVLVITPRVTRPAATAIVFWDHSCRSTAGAVDERARRG